MTEEGRQLCGYPGEESRGREVRLGRGNSRAGQRVSLALRTEEETKSLVKSSNITE